MDNQNDPNSPNNSSPTPPVPANSWNAFPTSVPTPVPEPVAAQPLPSPWSMPAQPEPATASVPDPAPAWTPPTSTTPQPDQLAAPEPWSMPASPTQPASTLGELGEPTQPEPVISEPVVSEPIAAQPLPTWTPPVQTSIQPEPWSTPSQPVPEPVVSTPTPEPAIPEPVVSEPTVPAEPSPTFTSPSPAAPAEPVASTPSPLDNPWGAPAQAPAIDAHQETTQPSWAVPSTQSTVPTESAPTDLSHLINSSQTVPQQPPENLVVPSAPTSNQDASATIPTESHKGIPVWLIGLGIGLLILVVGASAYFILGIGQPAKTVSLPAATPPPANTPLPVAQSTEQPVASGSANNFGDLQGGSTSGNQQQATSAADLLRQRQQGL